MKQILTFSSIVLLTMLNCSCVSAWIAGSTGVTLKHGMARSEVFKKLGKPISTTTGIPIKFDTITEPSKIRLTDEYRYRGKINSPQEGAGQATVNAITLGTAEAVMIPLTLIDIAIRSGSTSDVFLAYDANLILTEYFIVPLHAN